MRKEIKYSIDYNDYMNLKNILNLVMKKDTHSDKNGEYKIKSMYFDNCYNKIKIDKLNHINSVKKYRIRMYNNDENTIYLERKSNENGFIEKITEKITKKDVINLINNDYYKLFDETSLLKQELYINIMTKIYRPVIIIGYDRLAYRDELFNVSVTIDKNIISTTDVDSFFDEISPTNKMDKYILEIKYENKIPEYIKNIIKNLDNKKINKAKFITLVNNSYREE